MHLALAAAAKLTVWEKIKAVPFETWGSVAVAILVLILLVRIWKNLREFNEFAPWIALFMVGGSVLLYWTYERTEPKILSPAIDYLADYLPSRMPRKDADSPR